jgi:hypothetical protein
MVYFQTKNPNLGIFGGPWNGKCWYILWQLGILDSHLVHLRPFVVIWYIFPRFGMFYQDESGNPVLNA